MTVMCLVLEVPNYDATCKHGITIVLKFRQISNSIFSPSLVESVCKKMGLPDYMTRSIIDLSVHKRRLEA